ncbi:ATP-binding protein [Burkholderia territorii]|uniref:ATP-binding protein n=1 Tax=Burkholderia territorii TaxID=1503055 RepID=UPI000759713E|nr:ATP-binding protein [Burkholderia territorii]KVG53495.1 histidine kinase [Burkholderia territorii]
MLNLKGHTLLISLMIGLMPSLSLAETPPQFTAEEKAWIAAHPVVRTRVASNWRPFEFREGGKVLGIVPSYLDAVSRISGLRFEYADDVSSWPGTLDALMSRKIDIVPDVSSSADLSRYRDVSIISQPYFVGTMVVVASESSHLFVDFQSLSGSRVAIKGGGGLEYGIRRSGIPVILLTYADERDALAAVADGDADVAVGTDASIVPLLRRQFKGKLFVSGGLADRPYALALATRRDLPTLASILDKSLASIPARETEEIPRRWIESVDYGKPTLHSILYYHRWQVVAASVTLLGLVAIAFVSWRSRVAAVRSEREKAMFVAFISHEIRTPMHTILASLELLQRSRLTPKQAARADAAVGASESLLTLLDDILEYSRLESHSVTLSPKPTHVMQWAQRSADMVHWRVEERKLSLTLEIACPPELCVLIDPIRTRQIALNLLVNAIKFTSAGSIVLRVDFLEGKKERAGSLVIEVRDTGIGIPHERQRRIFEPYQRVEEPGSRRVSGSGLGLAICRELVGLMKGVVTVSSNPDKGTVFTVIIPARRTEPAPKSSLAERQAIVLEPPVRSSLQESDESALSPQAEYGPIILVIDDHEAVQHAISHQLDALACRSAIAGTGTHALEQFERMQFDMVLLDCDLPDIDGYAVAERMRDSERLRQQARTPIIAISAATDDAHRERCFASGMDGVLGKPLRLESLRQMIDLWCPTSDTDAPSPVGHDSQRAAPDFRTIYRQSIDADLTVLGEALSCGDVNRARHAAHRVKGAAAIAGHAATSELAAKLEHQLQSAAGTVPNGADALRDELLRLHYADTAAQDPVERSQDGANT